MGQERELTRKMSRSSDQKVPKKVPGRPALEKNIKELSETELKRKTAEKMRRN